MINNREYYLNTFNTDEKGLEKLISEAIQRGGSYSDLFFENTCYSALYLRDSEVSSGGLHLDYGAGVRTLNGEKTGYAYSESTAPEALSAAAKAASAIAPGICVSAADSQESRPRLHGRPNPAADRYPLLIDPRSEDCTSMVKFLKSLEQAVAGRESRAEKITASISTQVTDVLMYNSFGEIKYDTRPLCSVSVYAIFKQGDRRENSSASRSFRMGCEMLTHELIEELAEQVTADVDQSFEARRPKGGTMNIVMAAGASGILLHEAMGHAFEADFNRKGQSIFCGKTGQRICGKGITIVDDATIRGNRGALNFDDDGVPGQRTVMVEDGILTSYLHDRVSAKWFGLSPTGNGRRESFRYSPIPRMRATYMESGQYSPEEIIRKAGNGIYVDKFANGQVKIGEGDFTFYVKSGRMIENGKLGAPIKDINIIGNGPQALADIEMVGNDGVLDNSTWTCGKEQSVPVSCGIPTVLVKNLTVGGE